jgi:endoglucanase
MTDVKKWISLAVVACVVGLSPLLMASIGCTKGNHGSATDSSGRIGTPSAGSTAAFRGMNWADPRDNYATDNLVLSGLNASDPAEVTLSKARVIIRALQRVGANTIRIPINPPTVSGSWWGNYSAVIDTAVSMGMKVIIGYWESKNGGIGRVEDSAQYWNMWQKVISRYAANNQVYLEVFNEPHGYAIADLTNLYAQFLGKFASFPPGRIFLDGGGYAQDVNSVGADGRLVGCLLSYHIYTWFYNNDQSVSDWIAEVAKVQYPGRTVMTEFGCPMTTGNNYLGVAAGTRDIPYFQGVTQELRQQSMGSVYWPGLRTNDTYSMLWQNDTGLVVNNASGLYLLQYAWGENNK